MPAMTTRSRQGCDECRRRRRKCGEQKPCCSQCSAFNRTCKYTLRVVWQVQHQDQHNKKETGKGKSALVRPMRDQNPIPLWLPQHLPNGIPLSPRYQRLLHHFTRDILASLSCHPSVHQDLGQGLLPATLESPQLMSACLALSAAGFLSRGILSLDGVEISKILGHLQSSGLGLLRSALQRTTAAAKGQAHRQAMNETLLATCLIWCLSDIFTYHHLEGEDTLSSSWRIHLQGIQALLYSGEVDQQSHPGTLFSAGHGSMQTAMKHLYQLYLSLETLPYIPQASTLGTKLTSESLIPKPNHLRLQSVPSTNPAIDGFLGYSDELLYVLHQIDQLARSMQFSRNAGSSTDCTSEADILLGKVKAMIMRDSKATLPVTLSSTTSTPSTANIQLDEYAICHQIFQQATLIQLYRQLYRLPSRSTEIQSAFDQMVSLFSQMESTGHTSVEPCHTWVAMAMPLFTLGCEAVSDNQREFVLAKVHGLEECIRSSHVSIIRQALKDMWDLRNQMGDDDGDFCAGDLLERLDYNIILF